MCRLILIGKQKRKKYMFQKKVRISYCIVVNIQSVIKNGARLDCELTVLAERSKKKDV